MEKDKVKNEENDQENEEFWGKYVEITLKNGNMAKGLVITQAGDTISISDEFKNLDEYKNYKPQIMGSCGVVYPHSEGYNWNEIDKVEVVEE